MNGTSKYMGWVQLAAGIAAIFLQVLQSLQHGSGDATAGALGVGLTAGGVAHITRVK